MLAHQDETSTSRHATSVAQLAAHFTRDELERLQVLHIRYEQAQDTFSEHELASLCFLRWLLAAGRAVS
jgi:hypothetical protein